MISIDKTVRVSFGKIDDSKNKFVHSMVSFRILQYTKIHSDTSHIYDKNTNTRKKKLPSFGILKRKHAAKLKVNLHQFVRESKKN